jgi:predicted phage tail protein
MGLLTVRPFRFYAWLGLEKRSTPRLARVSLRLALGVLVILASFWIPVRFFGAVTGATMGIVLWVGAALMLGS